MSLPGSAAEVLQALKLISAEVDRLAASVAELAPRPTPQAEHSNGEDRLVWTVPSGGSRPWKVIVLPDDTEPPAMVYFVAPSNSWSGDLDCVGVREARGLALAILAAVEANEDELLKARMRRDQEPQRLIPTKPRRGA